MDEVMIKSILEQQTSVLRSMREQQTALLTSMREQQTAFLICMRDQQTDFLAYMKSQQTSMDKHQTGLLTSINEHLAKLNASNNLQMYSYKILVTKFDQFEFVSFCLGKTSKNKLGDEDHMKKGNGEQKINKEEGVMCDRQLHGSPAPCPLSSQTEEKKYRLHIVGEVSHRATKDKMDVIKGRAIPHIEVFLKHGDERVPADHRLASVRVELVVLDVKFCIEELTDWPRKEFEDHFMMVSKNNSRRTRMTVEKGIFNLVGGHKVCTVASINESSCKQKVRLGVMVVGDGSVQERVLEGVSSNEFYVIHEPRGDSAANKHSKRQTTGLLELNTNGKRVINRDDTTLQPSTPYLQRHVQSPQKIDQHAMGEQPSQARNACWIENRLTTQIGNIGGAVPPQSYAPNSDQGLPALVHKRLDDNHGIPFEEAYDGFMPNPGHVDLSSQNLMMGGKNRQHEHLQGLQTRLSLSCDRLQAGPPVEARPIHMLGKVTGNARELRCDKGPPMEARPISDRLGKVTGNAGTLSCDEGPLVEAHPIPDMLGKVTGNAGTFSCAEESDLVIDLSLATQPQLTSTQSTRQPGNNGTGGGQGQPSTPQSNNLLTDSQGHTTAATTNYFTSAQININSWMYGLDAEMDGHEQVDGGRVGNGVYGGGNDGGRVQDENDDYDFWKKLLNNGPEVSDENSLQWHCTGTNP